MKANFFQDFRSSLALLNKDIREAGWRIEISPDKHSLSLTKFKMSSNGVPGYDQQGYLEDGEMVQYVFHAASNIDENGILKRNDRTILKSLHEVVFNLRKEMVNNVLIPTVEFEIAFSPAKKQLFHFNGQIVPRHLASWAQHQYWVSITNGQRIKYRFK
ncbi:MAG: hypothetical protein WA705_30385 [Candidatus Ozemobacteraceae bacterium]